MEKCKIIFRTGQYSHLDVQYAIPHCQTHDSNLIAGPDDCVIGRLDRLEEEMNHLEGIIQHALDPAGRLPPHEESLDPQPPEDVEPRR